MLSPVPLIDGHGQAGDLRYIIPGECHIVFVIHLQGNPCGLRTVTATPTLCVLKMAFLFKTAHREDPPVKLKGCDWRRELLRMRILFPASFPQPLHSGLLIHALIP